MTSDLQFLMLSAMYENGGNTTQRLLDGHPELFVYPFESQPGTRFVQDSLSSMFPVKYRWPVFSLAASSLEDYRAIIDEECKVRARTPEVSKFRHMPFQFSDDERARIYQEHVVKTGRSRAHNVAAFFRATFEAWKDFRSSGRERVYVGYSPIIVVDADKILSDFPKGHVLHVVRNPWSAYADTKKRPVPMSLESYMLAWVLNQHSARRFQALFPGRVHVARLEDSLEDPSASLRSVCEALGLEKSETLRVPSWNGVALQEVYPWGTIRKATPQANRSTAGELSEAERGAIRDAAGPYLETFDYKGFLTP
ncbi:MAG: sulfotransferase [Acidobacteriota bacterium]